MWGHTLTRGSYIPICRGADPYNDVVTNQHRAKVVRAHRRHKLVVGYAVAYMPSCAEIGASLPGILYDEGAFS